MYQEFKVLVDGLVALNKNKCYEFNKRFAGCMSRLAYAMEFATVRVNIGRRAGHTSYIAEKAAKNDLVVVPSYFTLDMFKHCPATVVTKDYLLSEHFCIDSTVQNVYIDNPSVVFRDCGRIAIYNAILGFSDVKTFILLGD